MCTNAHYVTNVYTGKRLLVRCGKCEACQQEKATARSNRIRNNLKDGYIALFSTHTYSNNWLDQGHQANRLIHQAQEKNELMVYYNSFQYSQIWKA